MEGGPEENFEKNAACWRILVIFQVAIITTFMESVFINATIITEFVLV